MNNHLKNIESKIDTLDSKREVLSQKNKKLKPFGFSFVILLFLSTLFFSKDLKTSLFIGGFGSLIFTIIYYFLIGRKFKEIKDKYKGSLVLEFMNMYHPDINFEYLPTKAEVKNIISNSRLVSANRFSEEDVITGELDKTPFYISEIKLKRKKGKKTKKVFDGMLFKLDLEDAELPPSIIQSHIGLLDNIFGNFSRNEEFGFEYLTKNELDFKSKLEPLFPFIQYLIQRNRDVRIEIKSNQILILMDSDMKFLDDPKIDINNSLHSSTYYEKLGQQINSLLYIVETFAKGYDRSQIEEKLELKSIVYAEKEKVTNRS